MNSLEQSNEIEPYQMKGQHWMATMREVEVLDPQQLKLVVEHALIGSGATIVGYQEHLFDCSSPNHVIRPVTFCFLLCESHCTVHTYPECKSLWMDCFTCGDSFDIQHFQEIVTFALRAGTIETNLIHR